MRDAEGITYMIGKLPVILDDQIVTVHVPFIMELLELFECSRRNRAGAAVLHKEEGLLFIQQLLKRVNRCRFG